MSYECDRITARKGIFKKAFEEIRMFKLRFNKPKMAQRSLLLAAAVLCLVSRMQGVSAADEENGMETTTFGKWRGRKRKSFRQDEITRGAKTALNN